MLIHLTRNFEDSRKFNQSVRKVVEQDLVNKSRPKVTAPQCNETRMMQHEGTQAQELSSLSGTFYCLCSRFPGEANQLQMKLICLHSLVCCALEITVNLVNWAVAGTLKKMHLKNLQHDPSSMTQKISHAMIAFLKMSNFIFFFYAFGRHFQPK